MRTIRSYGIISGFLIVLLALFKTLTSGFYSGPKGALIPVTEYYDSVIYDINEDFYQVKSSNSSDFSYKVKVKLKIKKRFRPQYSEYYFFPTAKSHTCFKAVCRVSYFQHNDYLSGRFHFSFKLRGPPTQHIS